MQFHLNGYQYGDPSWHPNPQPKIDSDAVDVLIVGTGPAGLVLAAQLAAHPGISTRIIEKRDGPLKLGQADGIACRTLEMFQAFGLANRIVDEAYWVNETVFWRPDPQTGKIVRTGRVQDTEDGLSEFPHVIVNQARIQQFLLESMQKSVTQLAPDYGVEFLSAQRTDDAEYPVLAHVRSGEREFSVPCRYLVGCDGARSNVRQATGHELKGDFANHAWGVLDMLAVTDFPDIRMKAAIQSAQHGNILLIPREGGYLVRLYVDLGDIASDNHSAYKSFTQEYVIQKAQAVLSPYTLDVREVAWFSVYSVGQRVAQGFDDNPHDPRIFIAGDACHTHSAKAGQGMNVSMQDTFNLGWKLISVLLGRAQPHLLQTYTQERQRIAQGLIDFDKEWSKIMGSPALDPRHPEKGGVDPQQLQEYFTRAGRYTAGVATHYPPDTCLTSGDAQQELAEGFVVGMRLHSAMVTRLADGKPMQLGHAARADGAWRLYAFADESRSDWTALASFLEQSLLPKLAASADAPDSILDVRAIFQQDFRALSPLDLPAVLLPRKGQFGLIDYEKAYCAKSAHHENIFDVRKISRAGAMVLVRPDQYVAHILPLRAHEALYAFFARFMNLA